MGKSIESGHAYPRTPGCCPNRGVVNLACSHPWCFMIFPFCLLVQNVQLRGTKVKSQLGQKPGVRQKKKRNWPWKEDACFPYVWIQSYCPHVPSPSWVPPTPFNKIEMLKLLAFPLGWFPIIPPAFCVNTGTHIICDDLAKKSLYLPHGREQSY